MSNRVYTTDINKIFLKFELSSNNVIITSSFNELNEKINYNTLYQFTLTNNIWSKNIIIIFENNSNKCYIIPEENFKYFSNKMYKENKEFLFFNYKVPKFFITEHSTNHSVNIKTFDYKIDNQKHEKINDDSFQKNIQITESKLSIQKNKDNKYKNTIIESQKYIHINSIEEYTINKIELEKDIKFNNILKINTKREELSFKNLKELFDPKSFIDLNLNYYIFKKIKIQNNCIFINSEKKDYIYNFNNINFLTKKNIDIVFKTKNNINYVLSIICVTIEKNKNEDKDEYIFFKNNCNFNNSEEIKKINNKIIKI
jgi:hypothetical protein